MPAVDATHIYKGLYQGGRPPVGPWVKHAGFDTLVLAAREFQPAASHFPGVLVHHVPMPDAQLKTRHADDIYLIADRVAREVAAGRRVLVTCWAGLNRSGIINAAVLRRLTGANPGEIVRHIRRQRGGRALRNPHFVDALMRGKLG